MQAFLTDATYINQDNKTIVFLFGKLENNQSFISQHEIQPYFYIKKSQQKKIAKELKQFKIQETKLTNFKNEPVIKIIAENQTLLNNLYNKIRKKVEHYEADIKPPKRLLLNNQILSTLNIEGDYISTDKVDRLYNNPFIKPSKSTFKPKLKIASIDIETDAKTNTLINIGISCKNYYKTIMVTKHKIPNVINCNNEEQCLEIFKKELNKLDPDIITGWNFIDFDLAYLNDLSKKYKIPLDIGRTNSNLKLRIETSFFRTSSASLEGRQILDGLSLIRDPLVQLSPTIRNYNFPSYSLENIAQTILKKGKLLKGNGAERHAEIAKLYKQNTKASHKRIADYNLLDCKLVSEILEKTQIITLAIERSQLTGMLLNRIGGSIASFDSLYIAKAHEKNLVCPTQRYVEKSTRIKGGYVQSLKPGIYNNILVLDFKSLYPSIIKTFNIDPASFLEKKEKNCITAPNKAYFKNSEGILPEIIHTLHQAREKAKKEKRELASYSIKIIQNSFFGVLASPNSRFFNLDIANAITHFGQFIIKLTAKEVETEFKTPIIYSDTDSIFVQTNLNKIQANALGNKIQLHINNFYKKYTKKHYNRKSFLELEFEKQYLSLVIPHLRDSEKAAKKRYAGLIEKNGKEKMEIVGLEAIRGDWTQAAKEFQVELLKKIFHKQNPSQFIKSYIKQLISGKLDEKLVYKKSIRKQLVGYTKTTPPHVKAARKLKSPLTSSTIEYYITTDGPEPIQQLQHPIDYQHYINKQIEPIATQILSLQNLSFDDIVKGSKQSKLF